MLTKQIDWGFLKQLIKTEIDNKFKIDKSIQFNRTIKILRDMKVFDIGCKDFWKTYNRIPKVDKQRNFLPENLYEEYKEFFDKTTWYELLGFDTSCWYQTKKQCINALAKLHKENVTKDIYHKLCTKDNKLPPNPAELFKKVDFTTIENEFNKSVKHVVFV